MALTLNASHPLYNSIQAFICPNEAGNGIVDLKEPTRTLTPKGGSFTQGSGNYGRHITPADSDNVYLLAEPPIRPSTENHGLVAFSVMVVVNDTSKATGGGSNQPIWFNYQTVPCIDKVGGFAALSSSASIAPSTITTADVVQNGAYSLVFNHKGSTVGALAELFVKGVSVGTIPTTGGGGGLLDKLGSAWPYTRNISQYVYWVFFNRVLTSSEVSDLHASLGSNNSFSLLDSGGGTSPTGTVTIGTITPSSTGASVPFTYSAADQTGFEYQLNETGTIYPIAASPATPTGLTPLTPYTIRVRAVNDSGEGAWSTSAPFTTSAAGSPPAGTFTVGTITTTQTTASVPYTYSAADQTSIEYRIDGGAAITASASPQSVTGLAAGATYGIEFRAVNTFGNGAWSTSAPFTTAAAAGTITITDLANNTNTPWISSSVDAATIMPLSLGSVVVNKTGLSTTAGADLVIADASIVTGTEYIIILKIGTAYGWYRAVAT